MWCCWLLAKFEYIIEALCWLFYFFVLEEQCSDEDDDDENDAENGDQWYVEQQNPNLDDEKEEDEEEKINLKNRSSEEIKYGFAQTKSNVFTKLSVIILTVKNI